MNMAYPLRLRDESTTRFQARPSASNHGGGSVKQQISFNGGIVWSVFALCVVAIVAIVVMHPSPAVRGMPLQEATAESAARDLRESPRPRSEEKIEVIQTYGAESPVIKAVASHVVVH
jgi:hypothetical protein